MSKSTTETPNRPRRFYKEAAVLADGPSWVVALDGAAAKTPGGTRLTFPSWSLADAVAQEWRNQADDLDLSDMPLTRLANSALDGVARDPAATRADLVRYAGSDLLCYRASDPASLVAAQNAAWNPILEWAQEHLGASFVLAEGIVWVDQPPQAIAAVRAAVDVISAPFALAALHVMTHLTGSALLALAVAHGRAGLEEAWRAAHVDEDEQAKRWGEDAEAMRRRARRFEDMASAVRMFVLAQETRT